MLHTPSVVGIAAKVTVVPAVAESRNMPYAVQQYVHTLLHCMGSLGMMNMFFMINTRFCDAHYHIVLTSSIT